MTFTVSNARPVDSKILFALVDIEVQIADVIDRMAKGHPINRLSELLPWNWKQLQAKLAA